LVAKLTYCPRATTKVSRRQLMRRYDLSLRHWNIPFCRGLRTGRSTRPAYHTLSTTRSAGPPLLCGGTLSET
jgi:hypothetical protein